MTVPVFNVKKKDVYLYRIKDKSTGEYCLNYNNEPCECGTEYWAKILYDSLKNKNPNSNLVIVREKYNVKR